MDDVFSRVWENLVARTEGPMNLRFLFQPCVSLFFAIKAGFTDAKNGTVPFLWRFIVTKDQRGSIAKEGWKDFGKIFMMGLVLDVIYQLLVIFSAKKQTQFYPLESVIVAIALAVVPYLLFRGPVSRIIVLLSKKKHQAEG